MPARLRSCIWSSETLQEGMTAINGQPLGMMVKQEVDAELVNEYEVPRLLYVGLCL